MLHINARTLAESGVHRRRSLRSLLISLLDGSRGVGTPGPVGVHINTPTYEQTLVGFQWPFESVRIISAQCFENGVTTELRQRLFILKYYDYVSMKECTAFVELKSIIPLYNKVFIFVQVSQMELLAQVGVSLHHLIIVYVHSKD